MCLVALPMKRSGVYLDTENRKHSFDACGIQRTCFPGPIAPFQGCRSEPFERPCQSPLAGAIFKGEDEVVRTLVELGSDPRAGTPSAIDSAKIFGQDKWLDLLGATDEERARPNAPIRISNM